MPNTANTIASKTMIKPKSLRNILKSPYYLGLTLKQEDVSASTRLRVEIALVKSKFVQKGGLVKKETMV